MLRLIAEFKEQTQAQRGHLFPWCAVFFGVGVGGFFLLRFEPELLRIVVLVVGLSAILGAAFSKGLFQAVLVGVVCLSAGFSVAAYRTHLVSEPVLGFRYYGPVEGRIVNIDRSASDVVRLTLDQVELDDVAIHRIPARVRVSLHGDQSHFDPLPGETVMMAAHLSPPSGPVEPGGFDFQRHAWFLRLGGVGYTRTPVMVLEPSIEGFSIFALRMNMADAIRATVSGDAGAFAAAVMTGDRSAMGQSVLDDLRASNLAHLLAISGLHMGFLAGVVFGAFRGWLALWPFLSMRLDAKKISAVGALMAATFYLALSGGAIATERAYVMISVALCAVLLGRKAISLRAVAVAALIVLTLSPEALLSPGFQMSFSATTGLVAVFAALRDSGRSLGPRWLRPVVVLLISSSVAGAATGPFSAAHFNQIAQFGLLANILSVPVMGMLVIPGAVLAAVLAPIGGAWIGLSISAVGLEWILLVSAWVADMENSIRPVVQPRSGVLAWLSLGALVIVLWQGRMRWIGAVPFAVSIWMWIETERPYVLIADSGGLVGVENGDGRVLSKVRGAGFVADVWLENDGDSRTQAEAAMGWPVSDLALPVRHVTGKKAVAGLTCLSDEIVVVNKKVEGKLSCQVISPTTLRQTGSISIDRRGNIITARDISGARVWHPWGRDQ